MKFIRKVFNSAHNTIEEIIAYIVGKASKNRDDFIETVEAGEEVIEESTSHIEIWTVAAVLIVTVLLQFYVSKYLMIWFVYKIMLNALITYVQVKVISVHFRTANKDTNDAHYDELKEPAYA